MCDMVSAGCLHVHAFACALSWGIGFFWRIQNEHSCWDWVSAFWCGAQATLLVTLWLLLLAEYLVLPRHECPYECVLSQKEAHCVLVSALACAPTVVGHPKLQPALQPGGWLVCEMACGSVWFPSQLHLHDMECGWEAEFMVGEVQRQGISTSLASLTSSVRCIFCCC